jgi:hypothetical protein
MIPPLFLARRFSPSTNFLLPQAPVLNFFFVAETLRSSAARQPINQQQQSAEPASSQIALHRLSSSSPRIFRFCLNRSSGGEAAVA